MENTIFNYNGNNITFTLGNGDIMVNATEMAKPFGKRPAEYLRLPSTKQLIDAIVGKSHFEENQLVKTIRGGLNPSTFFHEDIALDFAQWLSVDFKLWCNDRLKELLKHGITTTSSIDDFLNNPDALIKSLQALKKEREQKELLQIEKQLLQGEIKKAVPKVNYYDEVLQSNSTYTTNQIAKELGMSAVGLNKKLHDLHIQYKQSNTWLLYAKYQDKSYTKTKTHTFIDSHGKQQTAMNTVWTEKGRKFIHTCVDITGNKLDLRKRLDDLDKSDSLVSA